MTQLFHLIRDIPKTALPVYEKITEVQEVPMDMAKSRKGDDFWQLTFILHGDVAPFQAALAVADGVAGVSGQSSAPLPVVGEDWEVKTINSFQPITIENFFIHRFEEEAPEGMVPLKIPAGLAFGTGEHPSTAECLRLLTKHILKANKTPAKGLDMGCGSGILSIAACKTLPNIKFVAVDIEADSIHVCNETVTNNHIEEGHIRTEVADGFTGDLAAENGPYDLVFANMTANPVCKLSPDFAAHMQSGGLIFISGYLDFQRDQVHNTYLNNGFEQVDEWQATDARDVWVVGAYRRL